jgi:hypothetical protein
MSKIYTSFLGTGRLQLLARPSFDTGSFVRTVN